MTRQRLTWVFALVLVALPAGYAHAAGGTYEVVFCGSLNRVFGGEIESNQAFSARSFCNDAGHFNAVQIESVSPALNGRAARAFWEAPEPLAITGVSGEARLRRSAGFMSELYVADADREVKRRVAIGRTEPPSFTPFGWEGDPQAQFVAELRCEEAPSCPASPQAFAWVRDLRFTVADLADPEVEVEGSLFEEGWRSGEVSALLEGRDTGAGTARLFIEANGLGLLDAESPCQHQVQDSIASAFIPCGASSNTTSLHQTSQAPFVDGLNEVRSCVEDFAANTVCITHQVRVDNELPSPSFALQNPEDPELIRVPVEDAYSGLSTGAISYRLLGTTDWQPLFTQIIGGELNARVDSAAEPPGTYEFMATATDVAGNTAETLLREDGTPMTLEFPLRSAVELSAHIEPGGSERTMIPYGRTARVEGFLLDAAGRPLAHAPVVVDENFGEGALIDHRVRTVMTNGEGRWRHQLPAGPTRSVTASYEGDQRYLNSEVDAGRLTVESGAELELSRSRVREGRATTFTGEIARLGARIPAAGKLVQLQYFDPGSGRWFTVRNPFRTQSNGRFKFRYAFGTHYVTDVAIKFRLNVPAERGWPYRGTHTRAHRVIVEARS